MRRLNIERMYLKKMLETKKYFVDKKFEFEENEPMLLQLVKRDEPGSVIGRVKAVAFFEQFGEDKAGESIRLYSKRWKYVITFKNVKSFHTGESFNLEDIIPNYEEKYNSRIGIIKLDRTDEAIVRKRIERYLDII